MASERGEKELKTDWDATTAADETKFIGHETSLAAEEGSLVPSIYLRGIR